MRRLKGKVAIVTGAGADGIGRQCGLALASEGARIVFSDLNEAGATLSAEAVKKRGGSAIAFRHDVSDEAAWRRVVTAAVAEFGRINVLLNNAGEARVGPIEALDLEDMHFLQAVNVDGAFLGIRAVWPHMKEEGGGSIINTASLAGVDPNPWGTLYCASKASLIGLTRSAAIEGAVHDIRVNALVRPENLIRLNYAAILYNPDR